MSAPLKRPIEPCRDIGRETSSSVLAARRPTWDQGAEMAQHDRLKIKAGIQV